MDKNDGAVSKENVDMLQVSLNSPLKPGIYQVNWSIISDDGDPVKGNFKFTVGNASSTEKQQDDVGVKVDGTLTVFPDAIDEKDLESVQSWQDVERLIKKGPPWYTPQPP